MSSPLSRNVSAEDAYDSGSGGVPSHSWPPPTFQRISPPTAPTSHPQFSSLNAIMASSSTAQQPTRQTPAQPHRFWEAKLVVVLTFLMICDPDMDDYEMSKILGSTVPDATSSGKRAFDFTEERVANARVVARSRFKGKNKPWYKYAKGVVRTDPRVPELLEVLKTTKLELGHAKDPKFDFWMGQHHPPTFDGMVAVLNQMLDKVAPPPVNTHPLAQAQYMPGGGEGQMGFSPTSSVSSYYSGSPQPRAAVPHFQAPHARTMSQSQARHRRTSSNASGSRPQNLRQRIAASRLSSEFPPSGSSLPHEFTNDFGAMMGGFSNDQTGMAGPSAQSGGMFGADMNQQGLQGFGEQKQQQQQQQQEQPIDPNILASSSQTAFFNPHAGPSSTAQMQMQQQQQHHHHQGAAVGQNFGNVGDPDWDLYYVPDDDDFLLLDEDAAGEHE